MRRGGGARGLGRRGAAGALPGTEAGGEGGARAAPRLGPRPAPPSSPPSGPPATAPPAAARMAAAAAPALYACTKCNQRYPFEELSQGQQLCKVPGERRERAGGGRPRSPASGGAA